MWHKGVATPEFFWGPKNWGEQNFDLRQATVFLFGTPLLKTQMTRYAKHLESMAL